VRLNNATSKAAVAAALTEKEEQVTPPLVEEPASSGKPNGADAPEAHLKLVADSSSPEDIFNNMVDLRKVAEHKVQRKAVPVNMSVGRPPDTSFFQCHPDPEQYMDASLVYDREERDCYYPGPNMMIHPSLAPRMRRVTIATTCLWPSGRIMLYPVPFSEGKRAPKCWKTARRAFRIAAGLAIASEYPYDFAFEIGRPEWVSLVWNDDTQDYDLSIGEGIVTKPGWPQGLKLSNSLKMGFRDKTLVDDDHPFVRQLRGLTE
jgi:hypothetical protein